MQIVAARDVCKTRHQNGRQRDDKVRHGKTREDRSADRHRQKAKVHTLKHQGHKGSDLTDATLRTGKVCDQNDHGKQNVKRIGNAAHGKATPKPTRGTARGSGNTVLCADLPRHGIKQKQVKQNCQCTGHVSECSVLGIPCCQSQRKAKHRRSELMPQQGLTQLCLLTRLILIHQKLLEVHLVVFFTLTFLE